MSLFPLDGVALAAALAALVLLAEYMAEWPGFRSFGSALLVILLGAVAGNLGLVPSGAAHPLYGAVFEYLAPLSIFWLLLQVDLRSIARAGGPMLVAFGVGAVGTVAGVLLGGWLVGGKQAFGEHYATLSGMFAGTYIGGSLNFNAVALEYGLVSEGRLYVGAVAADNVLTALWMMACLGLPALLRRLGVTARVRGVAGPLPSESASAPTTVGHAAAVLAVGLAALVARDALVTAGSAIGVKVSGMLVLTVLALALGPWAPIRRLTLARVFGLYAVQAFLVVIGVLCQLAALFAMGSVGVAVTVLALTTVAVHGLVLIVAARLFRLDPDVVAVASQANVGGGTTALALARGLGRSDLAVPGILVGSLGTAVGTFVGLALVAWLT